MSFRQFRQILPEAAAKARGHLRSVFGTSWGFLAALFLGSFLLNNLAQSMMKETPGTPNFLAIAILASTELTTTYLYFLVLPARVVAARRGTEISGFRALSQRYGRDLAAEMLRVAAGVVFGLLMGIVPGLIRGLRWIFVPFVVTTDADYAKGERDALEGSAEATKGLLLGLGGLWLLFTLLDMGFYKLGDWWEAQSFDPAWLWLGSLVISLFGTIAILYSTMLNFALYELRHKTQGDEK